MSTSLDQLPCITLKGVGPKLAICLKKLGIQSVQDLLFHLPLRYEDRTQIKSIKDVRPGEHVLVVGEIIETRINQGRRLTLLCHIQDETGYLVLRFFHFNKQQQQMLVPGIFIRCYGEVRWGPRYLEMIHPEYQCYTSADQIPALEDTLTPIYPTTEGLHQLTFRKLTTAALQLLQQQHLLQELLPDEVLRDFELPPLNIALNYVHRPPCDSAQQLLLGDHPYQQRLAFEELLAHQLSLARARARLHTHKALILKSSGKLVQQLLKQLPFTPTIAQNRVFAEIKLDLTSSHPMLRLLQGDVGSGKTLVAVMSILEAVECGFQAAIMAPTEILAEQHYKTINYWLSSLNISVTWLTSAIKGKNRADILMQIKSGAAKVIVGTHALFQDEVVFANLALIVVDEQHRFGVHQRYALREKAIVDEFHPHQLIMTATPIPRTLAMTAYGDLNCSVIDELPLGRLPVKTIIMPGNRRAELISRVRKMCLEGKQTYWVCTLIAESELLECQAAEKTLQELTLALPELRIGLIHGRIKPAEKDLIMTQFKNHELDLLVATTVIEVGVDVPNANLMIIENSERLGLAQLHQLRGRVGRGATESYCVLLYQNPLSKIAKERLSTLKDHCDGFIIAQKDLELRGPGEVLGTRQTGLLNLKIANLLRDQDHLPKVQQVAELLLQRYQDRIDPLIHRWLGSSEKFSEV